MRPSAGHGHGLHGLRLPGGEERVDEGQEEVLHLPQESGSLRLGDRGSRGWWLVAFSLRFSSSGLRIWRSSWWSCWLHEGWAWDAGKHADLVPDDQYIQLLRSVMSASISER